LSGSISSYNLPALALGEETIVTFFSLYLIPQQLFIFFNMSLHATISVQNHLDMVYMQSAHEGEV
jgi:hypothetical protein